MFLFSTDIPLQKLSGLYVAWICFSEGSLQIKFDNSSSILVIYTDDFLQRNNITVNKYIFMAQFIGSIVMDVSVVNKNKAVIKFSNGFSLTFLDLDYDLENYEFYIDGVEYLV